MCHDMCSGCQLTGVRLKSKQRVLFLTEYRVKFINREFNSLIIQAVVLNLIRLVRFDNDISKNNLPNSAIAYFCSGLPEDNHCL
jgi:hypothetical protein